MAYKSAINLDVSDSEATKRECGESTSFAPILWHADRSRNLGDRPQKFITFTYHIGQRRSGRLCYRGLAASPSRDDLTAAERTNQSLREVSECYSTPPRLPELRKNLCLLVSVDSEQVSLRSGRCRLQSKRGSVVSQNNDRTATTCRRRDASSLYHVL